MAANSKEADERFAESVEHPQPDEHPLGVRPRILEVETVAVFSMIGARPCTNWLPPGILLDARGFIKTGAAVAECAAWQSEGRTPYAFETSVPGIFAAGDVRSGSVKRCGAAVGEGSMAIENVHQMLGTYA